MLDNFILTEPIDVCLCSLIYPNYQTYSPFIPICYQSDSISNITQQQFSYQSKTDYWNKYSPINIPYSYFLGDIENRIKMFIDELKTHKYFYGNEMGDVGNDIGHIIYKYLTDDDNVDVFIGGLLHGISCVDGTHDISV